MTLGRIPWSKARRYGSEVLGFEGPALDAFWRIIASLDLAFLGWQKNEHDRYKRTSDAVGKSKGSRSKAARTYER